MNVPVRLKIEPPAGPLIEDMMCELIRWWPCKVRRFLKWLQKVNRHPNWREWAAWGGKTKVVNYTCCHCHIQFYRMVNPFVEGVPPVQCPVCGVGFKDLEIVEGGSDGNLAA